MDRKWIAVVRVRGSTGMPKELDATFKSIALTRVNHCVIVDNSPQNMGAIIRVKDYITWGEINGETAKALISKRGMLEGRKKLTDAHAKASGFANIDDYVKKLMAFGAGMNSIKGMKRVFRLHPPRKGYVSIKKRYPYGALGNRGAEMGELLKRMM